MSVYADFNGSAPLSSAVRDYLTHRFQSNAPFGNPNAIHSKGIQLGQGIESCRRTLAEILGAQASSLIFNSGASEGLSQILFSLTQKTGPRSVCLSSGIEHAAGLKALAFFCERFGLEQWICPTTCDGECDLNALQEKLKKDGVNVRLGLFMAANNETGAIQPIDQIAPMLQAFDIPLVCDSTQVVGKIPFSFQKSGADYAVCSGHKIGALGGTGILMAKNKELLSPYIFGGGQESDLRGGTQNYLGIETMTVALQDRLQYFADVEETKATKQKFENSIKSLFSSVVILGEKLERLPGTSLISYPGIHGQAVQIELESEDIFVTTSSACGDNEPNPSHVLKAMDVPDDIARGVVRISVGPYEVKKDFERIESSLIKAFKKLTNIKSY